MSIQEQIKEKEDLLDKKQWELDLAREGLKTAQINVAIIEDQLEAAKGIADEYQESVDNLRDEAYALDDEITDLKEARLEQPV